MLKKLVIAAALASATSVAMADSVGCGLGSIIFNGQSGLVPQVLAVTTNGTWGNQTFGITSGTLGCETNGVVHSSAKLGMYTGSNIDQIARDMSVGHGESLNVLADLMGIKDADRAHFFDTAKANFGKIFAPANQTAGDVLASLRQVMKSDTVLAPYAA